MRNVVVVGSLNADLVQDVPRLPAPGETIQGGDLHVISGGKGANQACAAARLGAQSVMVGDVGEDQFAETLLASLHMAGVDTNFVLKRPGHTGTACILVLPTGENVIVISPGTNGSISESSARERLQAVLEPESVLLCQLEIPDAVVEAVLAQARDSGATTVLDPAPAHPLSASLLASVNFLTPNQTEAGLLLKTSSEIADVSAAATAARRLLELGPNAVILKLGSLGCYLANRNGEELYVRAPEVAVRDTTSAGDTFNGAFAAALAAGKPVSAAIRFATAAASLSVTCFGAQSSMPTLAEVQVFERNKS